MKKKLSISEVNFIGSFETLDQLPPNTKPEYCFIGRSNVGKSSLINMLCAKGEIARISSQPGKTRNFNSFLIDDTWYLMDLPGYGYAKVSQTERERWEKVLWDYLFQRTNLVCVFLLVDINVPPQKSDIGVMNKLGEFGIPFYIIFTKADRQSSIKNNAALELYHSKLADFWETLPPYFITSAEKREGRENILDLIAETNETF